MIKPVRSHRPIIGKSNVNFLPYRAFKQALCRRDLAEIRFTKYITLIGSSSSQIQPDGEQDLTQASAGKYDNDLKLRNA